ncbi:hypothetical protein DP939_02130 [Spongiactinospora rosea]|uniref:Uncharacterized protein n=1 Tax=Spongiactinospora rosea TaxID=2248750 RepID=A0A366M5J1_9ACTN|nr:hypothetical protein [Spongiactinospora rosea]RBQ21528.1 hypothetical protein DP939_02130 [Spongiactinospora rosea]
MAIPPTARPPVPQASCSVCLAPHRLMYRTSVAPHDVAVGGEMLPCPGGCAAPLMAYEIREGDVLGVGQVRNVLDVPGRDLHENDVQIGHDWITLAADLPVIIRSRTSAVA